jgi:hypothetical protein
MDPLLLADNVAIAEYIAALSTNAVDEEMIEDLFRGCSAVLKLLLLDSLCEGRADGNIRSYAKKRRYAKKPVRTMPPIVVDEGDIQDGNHRLIRLPTPRPARAGTETQRAHAHPNESKRYHTFLYDSVLYDIKE